MEFTTTDIQNALRILTHSIPKGGKITIHGNDIVTVKLFKDPQNDVMGRTQEVADFIKRNSK